MFRAITTPRGLIRKALIALFLALLLFSGQLTPLMDEDNRYYLWWETTDGLAFVLVIGLLALLGVAGNLLVHALGWKWLLRLYNDTLFLTVLAVGVQSLTHAFWSCHPLTARIGLMVTAGAIGFSLGCPQWRLAAHTRTLCLIFSPLVPILFFQLLTFPSAGIRSEPAPPFPVSEGTGQAQGVGPVFFIIFDEWSYPRSVRTGEFLPFFVNLRQLSTQSFVFREARAPGTHTAASIPYLIYQRNPDELVEVKHEFYVRRGEALDPCSEVPHLFQSAREHGYDTFLLGYYLPYRKIVGDRVDYCHSLPARFRADNLRSKLLFTTLNNTQYLADPASTLMKKVGLSHFGGEPHWFDHSRQWFVLNETIREEALEITRNCRSNTFAFFHFPVPHDPFAMNPDGSYHENASDTPEDYERHLRYLDLVLGKFLNELRARDVFDDALIVVTSDHSWRADPVARDADALRHVPLFIKLPHQREGHIVDKKFSTTHLRPLLERAFQGPLDLEEAAELLDQ